MGHAITIENRFEYHMQVVFGLRVTASDDRWPKVVGCSLRTREGEIVDLPARWLSSGGLALWKVDVPPGPQFRIGDRSSPIDGWEGQVIFALYSDDTFADRLTDAGWQHWHAPWLIGGSTKSLNYQDERVQSKYGSQLDVWHRL